MSWYLGPSAITLNTVDGGYSNENLVAYMLDDLRCSAAVVVNEVKRAQMLLAPGPGRVGCPNTIFRLHDNAPNAGIKNDDGAYGNHAPEPFAQARWHLAPEGAFIYGDNEPNSANLEAQDVWNQRFIAELMRLNQAHYGSQKTRWKRPAIHAQSTLHPTQGIAGLKKYASSVRDLIAAEGMIIPHLYYYRRFEDERAKDRGSFAVIEEWRQLYGDDFPIVLSEFSFADGYQRTAGPRGATGIGMARFLDDTCKTAEYLARLHIYIAVYGTFPPNSEWEPFNVLYEPAYLAGIAKWNRENPMVQLPKPDLSPLHEATVTNAPAAGSNIREAPTTNASVVTNGKLNKDDLILISEKSVREGGYNWYMVKKGAIKGYVAAGAPGAIFDWEPKAPPTLPPNSPPINVEVATQLATSMEELADDHALLVQKYRGTASLLRSLFN